MIKTNYAVLDVPYNYDFSNDVLDHHVYESCDREKIAAELIRMGAKEEKYCVEIYKVNGDGEFTDGSYCVTPCNFIKQVDADRSTIYSLCVSEAFAYTDPDTYVSDMARSSIWNDCDEEIPEIRVNWLRSIWTAAHRTVKDICREAGYSQRSLARYFMIPLRTVENWCMGIRVCPPYLSMMMQENLGLVSRRYWL